MIYNLYTDKPFTLSDFSLEEELNVYFRIGIKNKYSINTIIQNLNNAHIKLKKISTDDDEIYIYFENLCDYKDVIIIFVLNLKNI